MTAPRSLDERAGEPAVAPPPGNPRFPLMDSLRAIAVACVFVFHVTDNLDTAAAVTSQLTVGVTIFFVISGFLLYRPYVARHLEGRPGPALRDFARRRVLRIVPAYWVALTVGAAVLALPGVFSDQAWLYYGFAQAYSSHRIFDGIPIAWSLCIEVTFYALLPFYAMAAHRLTRGRDMRSAVEREVALLTVVAIATIVVRTLVAHRSGFTVFVWASLPGTFFWFALGMALAVASAALAHSYPRGRRGDVPGTPVLAWIVAAALFAAVVVDQGKPERHAFYAYAPGHLDVSRDLVAYLLMGLAAAFVVLPAVFWQGSQSIVSRMLAWRWLGWLGLVSYGIYLWHKPLLDQFRIHDANDPLLWRATFVAAATVAIAAASYYIVERPLLRLKHRPGDRR
jgi:peptidoglycan/LPS O-acetylase OafA/YrhL